MATQCQRILKALQNHPEGITNVDMIEMFILNYKGRITELRQGRVNNTPYNIEAIHDEGGTWKYVLRQDKQLALFS